ncbi:MAG: flagellar motor switch protein FliG [Planctomycetaceae bacterium]|nr:flagellar motor switch protein FliG [Planctomycetales bacterium]MCB9875758.1 flagellar motor switch protein FliG [Planctomycetaceae bacterium]MCB9936895.1 flagellar motor switch protein FliG [Planctomycetaceae bacterium]
MASNLRKAAIVMMSLPRDEAAQIMAKFNPKQVESLSIEIAKLGRFTSQDQEEAILAFADANPHALGGSMGGLDAAQALLEQALGEEASGTVASIRHSLESLPFSFLKQVDPQNLLTFINDEHPQTIALILSHLAPAYGAQVIAGLTTDRQLAVISRIANMGQTSPEIIEQVESGLEKRMAAVVSQSFAAAGGIPSVAQILNVCDRQTEKSLLENLSQDDPELVEEIRRLMFVFEDINKLGDKDIQAILKNVETSQWAMALKGVSPELRQKILGNMSQRAAAMLEEEMEYLGPVRLSEVEAIQTQIVDIVRRLEETGEITVGGGADDGGDAFIS